MKSIVKFMVVLVVAWSPLSAWAENNLSHYPTAILSFHEKGIHLKGYGEKIGLAMFASLVSESDLYLVDRDDMDRLIGEAELNLSGMVNQQQAIQIGQLVGAKILISGSVFELGDNLIITAKIVGTETGRVVGAKVKGKADDDLLELTEKLAGKVVQTIIDQSHKLVANTRSREDRLVALKNSLGVKERPSVVINITERHVGERAIDPAAETEMMVFFDALGFKVIAKGSAEAKHADLLVKGEGFSEYATRHGNIVSVKARLEVQVQERKSSRVVAMDRQTAVEVDLSELIAGKAALQAASATIAERIITKIVSGL